MVLTPPSARAAPSDPPERPRLTHLRAIREARLLSQQELAELAGVARNTIQRVETGQLRPRNRTIRLLARALKVKPQELMGPPHGPS